MADLRLAPKPASYVAFALMLSFLGLLVYAVWAQATLGFLVYGVAVAALVVGFASREDKLAMANVILFCFLVILDVYLGVGLLRLHGP